MNDSDELDVGTIVDWNPKAQEIIVRLDDGTEHRCAGAKELHRKWGFLTVPIGQRVLVTRVSPDSRKLRRIVEVIKG